MSSSPSLIALQGAARRRAAGIPWLLSLPLLIGVGALMLRAGAVVLGSIALLLLALAVLRLSLQAVARVDAHWIARELDRCRPDLEDSADLFFRDPASLSAVARLQLRRLHARFAVGPRVDLRAPWPARFIAMSCIAGMVMVAAAQCLPTLAEPAKPTLAAADSPSRAPSPLRARVSLQIQPPAYTQLPARTQDEFAASVAEGSQLTWRVRFDEQLSTDTTTSVAESPASAVPRPANARLVFHDTGALALQPYNDEWLASRKMEKSTVYRLQFDDAATTAPQTALARLTVLHDQAPQVRVSAPERSLVLATAGQSRWPLSFEASDDYALGAASMLIRHAKGSGESITVTESRVPLQGQGDARSRRYQHSLDLRVLDFTEGDDLIVRFSVNDQRQPQAQATQTSSFILRWPDAPSTEAADIEGVVEKVLPAYFRSQRQIIIDSEALLAEKPRLAKDPFLARSDTIGVDQRLLRMRYGQFLGEESEVADAPHEHRDGDSHDDADADMHQSEPATATNAGSFGESASVIEAYGHTHDDAEAATLLDPQTRALLKSALNEMWQAELHLRQGNPAAALPFEYRALAYIKQVQQASRIYLARVGLELPPVDETRRLSGEREGLRNRAEQRSPKPINDPQAADLWRALVAESVGDSGAARLDAAFANFDIWLRKHASELPNALDLMLILDEARSNASCVECRAQVRQQLWTLLPHPAPTAAARAAADVSGRTYLRALSSESAP